MIAYYHANLMGTRTNVKSLFNKLVCAIKGAFALPEATPALAFA